jgi:hypothetical protein
MSNSSEKTFAFITAVVDKYYNKPQDNIQPDNELFFCNNEITTPSETYGIKHPNDQLILKYDQIHYIAFDESIELKNKIINSFPDITYYYYMCNKYIVEEDNNKIVLQVPKYAEFEYFFHKKKNTDMCYATNDEIESFFYSTFNKNKNIPESLFNKLVSIYDKPSKVAAFIMYVLKNNSKDLLKSNYLISKIKTHDFDSDYYEYTMRSSNVNKNKYMLSIGYYHNYNSIIVKIPYYVNNISELDQFIKLLFCSKVFDKEFYNNNPLEKLNKPIEYNGKIYNNYKTFALAQAKEQGLDNTTILTQ